MTKVIRKYQKIFLAIGGVLLMITFVAGYGTMGGSGRQGPADREIGRADGKPVMTSEVRDAHAELQAVNQYARRFGTRSASVLDAVLGPDVAANVLHQPELFVLLRREAQVAGVVPNPTQAQEVMDDTLGGTMPDGTPVDTPSPDSDTYAAVKAGITDLLTVANYYSRVTSALKVSRPAVDRALATDRQTIQLTLVPVPADAFTAKVPAPTPQQLADQFQKYADVQPGRPDPVTNPFGFGYRSPMRTTLQYLRLTRDAVAKAVVATQSDYDWEVEARKLYHAHPEQFAVSPPTTRPTDAPGPAVTPPFEKVRDDALRSLRDPKIQALQDQVQQFLTGTMARDYQAYSAAVAANPPQPAPATAVGEPYTSGTYLAALARKARDQFHVDVDFIQTDDLSAEQLQKDRPGLANASAALTSSTTSSGSLAGFVSDRALAFLASGDAKTPAAEADLLKPSPAFTEMAGDAVDLVRVSAVEPSRKPADLAEVRSAVEADVRAAAAYDQAKAQADALAAAANNNKGSLSAAATAAAGRTPIATQPLSMQDVAVDGLTPPLDDAAHDFLTQAFSLLDGYDPAKNPHPAKVIAVPAQRRLIVAQVVYVGARWTTADAGQTRLDVAAQLWRDRSAAARDGWFRPEAVVQRTNYKPAAQPAS